MDLIPKSSSEVRYDELFDREEVSCNTFPKTKSGDESLHAFNLRKALVVGLEKDICVFDHVHEVTLCQVLSEEQVMVLLSALRRFISHSAIPSCLDQVYEA